MGFCTAAFGLGLLVGRCFESGFLSLGIGIALILAGLCIIRQK